MQERDKSIFSLERPSAIGQIFLEGCKRRSCQSKHWLAIRCERNHLKSFKNIFVLQLHQIDPLNTSATSHPVEQATGVDLPAEISFSFLSRQSKSRNFFPNSIWNSKPNPMRFQYLGSPHSPRTTPEENLHNVIWTKGWVGGWKIIEYLREKIHHLQKRTNKLASNFFLETPT